MKRLYIGIGFLAVLLAVGIGITVAFDRIHTPLSEDLEAAGAAAMASDWQLAGELTERAAKNWRRFRNFTAAVADQEILEEMDAMLAQLEVYARQQETGDFAALCASLSRMARAMADSQSITWWCLL